MNPRAGPGKPIGDGGRHSAARADQAKAALPTGRELFCDPTCVETKLGLYRGTCVSHETARSPRPFPPRRVRPGVPLSWCEACIGGRSQGNRRRGEVGTSVGARRLADPRPRLSIRPRCALRPGRSRFADGCPRWGPTCAEADPFESAIASEIRSGTRPARRTVSRTRSTESASYRRNQVSSSGTWELPKDGPGKLPIGFPRTAAAVYVSWYARASDISSQ
jgi:hypothetical protein